ncbi:MAG: type II toxin-antitoxin system RelE/ParE family toxin [Bacteroidia bacterium]|nr:type II toxin-antitoxin system RelE/ParE family toxin [Bacteroidia bacterium]
MNYKVVIERPVIKVLEKIPEPDYSRIKNAILSLSFNPRPAGFIKLRGRSGYRIRKGDYRIIYEIKDTILIVKVIAIGHRKDIYD